MSAAVRKHQTATSERDFAVPPDIVEEEGVQPVSPGNPASIRGEDRGCWDVVHGSRWVWMITLLLVPELSALVNGEGISALAIWRTCSWLFV